MSLSQTEATFPNFSSRTQVNVNDVNPDPMFICCGIAFLSEEGFARHATSCKVTNTIRDPLQQEQDQAENEDNNDDSFQPVIENVQSLAINADDIADVDIYEEEPRALVEYTHNSSNNDYNANTTRQKSATDLNMEQYGNSGFHAEDEDEDDGEFEMEDVEVFGSEIFKEDEEFEDNNDLAGPSNGNLKNGMSRLKCEYPGCNFSTFADAHLQSHRKNAHDPTWKNPCHFCVCRFQTKSDLDHHMQVFHNPNKNATTSQGEPEIDTFNANGVLYHKCTKCDYSHHRRKAVLKHANSAHTNGEYPCTHCVCRFEKKQQLAQHMIKHKTYPAGDMTKQKPNNNAQKSQSVRSNQISNKSFAAPKSKQSVKKSPQKKDPSNCMDSIKFNAGNETFTCDRVTENGEATYYCKLCMFYTTHLYSMITHLQRDHVTNNPKFNCEFCVCGFNSNQDYQTHRNRVHADRLRAKGCAVSTVKSSICSTKPSSSSISEFSSLPPTNSYRMSIVNRTMQFLCQTCDFSSQNLPETMAHIKASHPFPSSATSNSNSSPPKSKAKASIPEVIEKKAPIVGTKFSTTKSLGKSVHRCLKCPYTSPKMERMKHHVNVAHDPQNPYKCKFCPCRYKYLHRQSFHMKQKHGVDVTNIGEPLKQMPLLMPQVTNNKTNSSREFKCHLCPSYYKNQGRLTLHMKNCHMSPTNNENEDMDKNGEVSEEQPENKNGDSDVSDEEEESEETQEWKCNRCDFTSAFKSAYVTHLTTNHSMKNQHQCSQCVCRFQTALGLATHIKKKHQKKGVASFKTKSSLFKRMQRNKAKLAVAANGRPILKCNECSFETPTSIVLKWHVERCHVPPKPGEPNFKCEICGYNYEKLRGLNLHKAKSHGITIANNNNFANMASTEESTAISKERNAKKDQVPLPPSRRSIATRAARKYASADNDDDSDYQDEEEEEEEKDDDDTEPSEPVTSTTKSSEKVSQKEKVIDKINQKKSLKRLIPQPQQRRTRASSSKNPSEPEVPQRAEPTTGDDDAKQSVLVKKRGRGRPKTPKLDPVPLVSKVPKSKLLRCDNCSFTCNKTIKGSHLVLYRHMKSVHKDTFIEKKKQSVVVQQKTSTNNKDEATFSDVVSSSEAPSKKLEKTRLSKTKKELSCSKCNGIFSKASILNAHVSNCLNRRDSLRVRKPKPEKQEEDDDDDEESQTEAAESQSTEMETEAESQATEMEVESSSTTENLSKEKDLKCSHCDFTCTLRIKMKNHEKKHGQTNEEEKETKPLYDVLENASSSAPAIEIRKQKNKKSVENVKSSKPKTPKIIEALQEAEIPSGRRKSAMNAMKVINKVLRKEKIIKRKLQRGEYNDDTVNDDDDDDDKEEDEEENTKTKRKKVDSPTFDEYETESQEDKNDEPIYGPLSIHFDDDDAEDKKINSPASEKVSLSRAPEPDTEPTGRTAAMKEFTRSTCSRCGTTFETKHKLVKHFLVCDTQANEFLCKLCDDDDHQYSSLLKLKEHIFGKHLSFIERQKCEDGISKNGKPCSPYSCYLCKIGLRDRKAYIYHMSVPHLFRCKKCPFVSNTKSCISDHKQSAHGKKGDENGPDKLTNGSISKDEEPSKKAAAKPDSDDIEILFESPIILTNTTSNSRKAKSVRVKPKTILGANQNTEAAGSNDNKNKETVPVEPLQTSNNDDLSKELSDQKMEISEPEEVTESLICFECGHVSENVEEAKEHNSAATDIGSLLCFVCGFASGTSCESLIHAKMHHQEEKESVDVEMPLNNSGNTVPNFSIEIEYDEHNLLGNVENVVEVPVVSDVEFQNNRYILFDCP